MKLEEAKNAAKAMSELSESGKELFFLMRSTAQETIPSKKLSREANKSRLIRLGFAIFVFPEPTPICEIIGAGVMAAGAIQQGIKNQAIYVEDIPKTLRSTFRELRMAKDDFML